MYRIRFLSASGSVEHSVCYGRGFCAGCSGARFVRVHWLRSSTQITEVGTLKKILLLACKSVARRQMKSLKLLRMRSPRMAIVTFLAPLGADFHLSRLFGFLQLSPGQKRERRFGASRRLESNCNLRRRYRSARSKQEAIFSIQLYFLPAAATKYMKLPTRV